ncbi:site-specific DNA-methyltransferase [Rhodoferax sediminis]|uniref:site-specific DNA-methyltransferase (adenine-specific) n=1 Tax=Rhodoferax sediminis TaxID=2509614 RepID=A0A515D9Y9_9BURK|nr:site-specific DNA-methyltransferase [Rhodoferax sediminis]QDL37228.1 site-specific DNA-methyltransferase [Rhodoferax sediminis]
MATRITTKHVETLTHDEAKRKNIPSVEQQSIATQEHLAPRQIRYPRNTDLDPQLVWRGKDEQDWSDLVVNAPPLYIQEKVHPKVLIDDLLRTTREREHEAGQSTADLFSDFNGIPKGADKTEFYQHDQNWTNRMILGDSLQVMASLAEREGLRGKVQCIYFDPPYGIKFNSNFQWSTTSNKVTDGKADHITREPEQVKAFRDTWRDGIHSYLTYMRDRLTVARDLLTDSGSIFVQISDENVHRVRAVMDELFGDENFVSLITFTKTTGQTDNLLASIADYVLWYAKDRTKIKYRQPFKVKTLGAEGALAYNKAIDESGQRIPNEKLDSNSSPVGCRFYTTSDLTSQSPGTKYEVKFEGGAYFPKGYWKTEEASFPRLIKGGRIERVGNSLRYVRFFEDYTVFPVNSTWTDTGIAGFAADKIYVVQTTPKVIERCILMATDPGDLVLDPTCGSGTTATVAEQWGRRWITIDTSRVALALARARIMGARYPFYLLADSREGQIKEAEVTRTAPSTQPVHGNIRHGFVYERVPHITLKSIANNAEIDVIWDKWQAMLEPLREKLNAALKTNWQEWEIPRELPGTASTAGNIKNDSASRMVDAGYEPKTLLTAWWQARIARQKEIDASIAAKAEFEYLYDKPYDNKKAVRVAGPFTVESLSPHRMLGVDEDDELIDSLSDNVAEYKAHQSFPQMILDNLKTAGVQQAHKADRISFTSLTPWPGEGAVCAEGRYLEGDVEKRAGIFIGPEFGTVQRSDLVEAARECGDAGFDVLIACAFNYEAHATEFSKLGRIPVLKARMNADLHMAADLKNTGKGNLFVIFGEPDIDILSPDGKSLKVVAGGKETYPVADGAMLKVKVNGVDVFKPQTGEVISDGADGIACWFIDTDYNEESFFVRHAYFLGANDPYSALKTTLKAEIDPEAWATLNSDTSRPFDKPKSGRIAVKIINHLGDEVMKVFKV